MTTTEDNEPISRKFDPEGANYKTSMESAVRRADMAHVFSQRQYDPEYLEMARKAAGVIAQVYGVVTMFALARSA